MADENAANQIRTYVERAMRLHDERAAIADEIKDLYADAKGNGLDTKALKAVVRDMQKDAAKLEEERAIFDLYWSAAKSGPRVQAHEVGNDD